MRPSSCDAPQLRGVALTAANALLNCSCCEVHCNLYIPLLLKLHFKFRWALSLSWQMCRPVRCGRAGGVGVPRPNSPNSQSQCPMCPACITSEYFLSTVYSVLSVKMHRHLFNQAPPLRQLIRLAGIQSHRLFGDAGAISCVNFSIYSAALLVRDRCWLLSTVYCTDPAHPDSVQIPIIDANNAGKCSLKIYACKCLCPIFDLRILPVSPKKSRAPCLSTSSVFRCLVFVLHWFFFLSFFHFLS